MTEAAENSVLALLRRLKQGPVLREPWLPVLQEGRPVAWLEPVSWLDADRQPSIRLLAEWREQAAHAFPSQFPVTLAGTQRWLIRQLLDVPDRILFWVTDLNGNRLGHAGLFHFDFAGRQVELDNVVRGVPGRMPGVMRSSVRALLGWAFDSLDIEASSLRVFSDNERAIRLYGHCGFEEVRRAPVARLVEGETVRWVEVEGQPAAGRALVTMSLPRSRWLAGPRQEEIAA